MNRDRVWLRILMGAGLALSLGAGTGASGQESSSTANAPPAAAQSAAPADQPRRRDRRRDAEAATATPAATTASTTDQPATAEDKMICKNIKPIGSRVARRICATEEQWAATNAQTSADANESMRQIRDRSGVTGGSSSGPASLGSPSF